MYYCAILSIIAIVHGNPLNIQYHEQNTAGQYDYGYFNPQSSKQESRSSDGVTRGSYSYVDADGKLQRVTYRADAENGFQLTSSSLLPTHSSFADAEQVGNKDRQANAIEITTTSGGDARQKIDRGESFASRKLNQNNPLIHPTESNSAPDPAAHPFPVRNQFTKILPLFYPSGVYVPAYPDFGMLYNNGLTPVVNGGPLDYNNQYHLHDGQGHYMYGYKSDSSAKDEIKGIDGVTRGAYSYYDANGELQSVMYTADAENGFRVIATNLPK